MKMSSNGLYIEEYVKCANCGALIYEVDRPSAIDRDEEGLFCSQWCVDWAGKRRARQAADSYHGR